MPSTELVQVIIQGGAVGLALVAMTLAGYIVRVLVNHLSEVTTRLSELAVNVRELTTILRKK